MPDIRIAPKSDPATFKKALNKLASDTAFREKALKNPETLTNEFSLSLEELHYLRQAAILTGADMSQINKVRAGEVQRAASGGGGPQVSDIDISCCCCCCCGETSVVRAFA